MIRVCCACQKIMGEKEPLEDKSTTHGLCDKCFNEALRRIGKRRAERNRIWRKALTPEKRGKL